MEKTAKITRTTFKQKWTPTTGNGSPVFYHDIELDNGDKGSIGAKEEMPSKLNPGSTITYTIEGTKIKAVQSAGSFQKGGGAGKFQQDPKIQFIGFAASYCKDIVCAGKINMEQFDKEFNRIYNLMISKL